MAFWLALPDPLAPVRGVVKFVSFGHLYGDAPINAGSAGTVVLKDLSKRHAGLAELANSFPNVPGLGWFNAMPQRFWLLLGLAALLFLLLHLSVLTAYFRTAPGGSTPRLSTGPQRPPA